MVLKKEHNELEEVLGTRIGIQVLRLLIFRPYMSFGLTQISEALGVSKSNILRVIKKLVERNIVIVIDSGKKKKYRLNAESRLVRELWKIFMLEKFSSFPSGFKNSIELLYNQIENDVECFVVFGSVAHGESTERSDIDIAVVGKNQANIKKIKEKILGFLPVRFEVHNFKKSDFKELKDFVILDCLLNGVVLKGDFIFDVLKELRAFPKAYLIYRIKKAREFLKKGKNLGEEAKAYYINLAKVSVMEVENVLVKKTILGKRKIEETEIKNIGSVIDKIEERLAKEGEKIWLIYSE